jgi:hypothetical protein
MKLRVENLSSMTPEQEKQFWTEFENQLDHDTGEAAKRHLEAGRPIYYGDPAHPDGVVKEYPDGHRQIVKFDMRTGEEYVVREL